MKITQEKLNGIAKKNKAYLSFLRNNGYILCTEKKGDSIYTFEGKELTKGKADGYVLLSDISDFAYAFKTEKQGWMAFDFNGKNLLENIEGKILSCVLFNKFIFLETEKQGQVIIKL